jgi:hypothetical protein
LGLAAHRVTPHQRDRRGGERVRLVVARHVGRDIKALCNGAIKGPRRNATATVCLTGCV